METKTIDELLPDPRNPRMISQHDQTALYNSMDVFGDLSCIVFNTRTQQLVGGHQRLEIMKKVPTERRIEITSRYEVPDETGTTALGYIYIGTKPFAYREVDWDEDTQQAANIAANRIQGEFNQDLLAVLTAELAENNPDLLALTGQRPEEISKLLDSAGTLTEDDEAPEVTEASPISVPGEIYQLGRHRLLCGDSANPAQVDRLMAGQRARMAFTDPPYNIGYVGKTKDALTIENDKMSGSEFATMLQKWCSNLLRVTDGALYICMSPKELGSLKDAFENAGGHWHDYIIWVKNHFTLGGGDYQHMYEPILYGWPERLTDRYYVGDRNKPDAWQDLDKGNVSFDGEHTSIKLGGYEIKIPGQVEGNVRHQKNPLNVWRFDRPARSEDHPTMKPIALCEEAIRNSSLRDEIVLDLFGGSGSTLIASDRLSRTCYMAETDPKYCDVIRKRYHKHITGDELGWEAGTPAIGA